MAVEQKQDRGQECVSYVRLGTLLSPSGQLYIDLKCLWNHSLSYVLWGCFFTCTWNPRIYQMISTAQREAEPHAVSCVELSRVELQHFISVLLFSIWVCADRPAREIMPRKEKPRSLEKMTPWEMVHSFGHDLSCLLKIFLMVTCILK